ncbi:unnamed protein product [Periconia digitata]|uniref:Uncharacterized protein n=1 Tax=Periconia digitata TaxID=1303443 RepID=A0A9W4XMD8_9PLEO|nr:unnamed protein product [Periconia digitata]
MVDHICGCYYSARYQSSFRRIYLPQVRLEAHTTIQSLASRSILKQRFTNPSTQQTIDEIRYAFPLFDGVSVVDFVCTVGERTIYGLVKEKAEAKKTYQEAKARGEQAALLEQLPDAADVFTATIGNIQPGAVIDVTITYVQELKHDAEVDGLRFTLPTKIAPRYGSYPGTLLGTSHNVSGDISLTVDICLANGVPIKKVISPSHPIELSLGSLSTSRRNDQHSVSKACATLTLGTALLDADFVLQVVANDIGVPQAVLETHPTIPNHRALLATLVPKFSLKAHRPEIIFLADRSGSMEANFGTLRTALKYFLKSIPSGCRFNICSFGSTHSSLWPNSQLYSETSLRKALSHVDTFHHSLGGTETLAAVKQCFLSRRQDVPTELILLTDGDIWQQQQLFDYIARETKSAPVRVFPIGIGNGVSSSLIEGIARAGNGFGQMIGNAEKMTSKIIRMLKAALMPHISDYRLEIQYQDGTIESISESTELSLNLDDNAAQTDGAPKAPISLFNPTEEEKHPKADEKPLKIPGYRIPNILQTPHHIPPLYPFHRTCVYLLMGPKTSHLKPKSVLLKGTSPQGPVELEIPIEVRQEPEQMIHQLAARKATQELEEGRGWISDATVDSIDGGLVRERDPYVHKKLLQKEAVRLGVKFQVGGKFCSFVAVEANQAEITAKRQAAAGGSRADTTDWEIVEDAPDHSEFDIGLGFDDGATLDTFDFESFLHVGDSAPVEFTGQASTEERFRMMPSNTRMKNNPLSFMFAGGQTINQQPPQHHMHPPAYGSSSAGTGFKGFSHSNNNSGGLFGTSSTPASGASLFGTSSNPVSGTYPFAQPSTPVARGGLFGQSNPNNGGVFGVSPKPAASTFGQSNSSSGNTGFSGFGAPQSSAFGQSNPSSGNSLFGISPKPATSAFGQSNPSSSQSLFGSSSKPSSGAFGQDNSNTGGSLFGGQISTPGATGGAPFGHTSPNTGGSIFNQNNKSLGYSAPAALRHSPPEVADQDILQQYQNEMMCSAQMPLPDEDDSDLDGGAPPPKKPFKFEYNSTTSTGPLLERLVDQQGFNGSWPSVKSIPAKEMGIKFDDVQSIIKMLVSAAKSEADQSMIETLVGTVLVVLHMERNMADEEETWELVVEKARTFIDEMQDTLGLDVVDQCWKLCDAITLD